MKKIFSSLILKIAVFSLLCVHFYLNRPSIKENIFDNKLNFVSPYLITTDSKKNIYVTDDRSRRATKMNPAGEVFFALKGGSRGGKSFFRAADITVDAEDNLYVLNAVDNLEDGYVEKFAIIRFNPDGNFDRVISELSRTKEERMSEDRLVVSNICVEGGSVYYFCIERGVGTVLYKVSLEKGAAEKVLTIPQELRTVNMSQPRNGKFFITKLDGRVYEVNHDGSLDPLPLRGIDGGAPFNPWDVETDGRGNIFVSDIANEKIIRVTPEGTEEAFFREKVISKSLNVSADGSLTCINEIDNSIYWINPAGGLIFKVKNGVFHLSAILSRFLVWGELVVIIFIGLIILKDVFINVMRRKIPLIIKQLFIFVPALILAVGFVSYEIFNRLFAEYEKATGWELAMYAQIASRLIDGDALERITKPADYGNADYAKIQGQMHSILNDNKDPWDQLPYSRIIKFKDGMAYICADWSGFVGTLYPFLKAQPMHLNAYKKGAVGFGRYNDIDVGLFSGVAPVRDSRGEIVGVYEIMADESILDELISIFAKHLTGGIIVSVAVFAVLISIITHLILASIRKLRQAVSRMARGEFETTVDIRTRDEVGDLGRGFNIMSKYIRDYIVEITRLNKTYVRFVPREFLHYLERKSIVDMKLGDQVQKEMTILFTDIRSFTSLSETMSPEENFNFINAYLKRMGPAIRDHNGFVDKYIGDAIMALFPEKAADAVAAALEIKKRLKKYNEARKKEGRKPIDVGIGIHTGLLMLGIIGEEERMEGTVISDSVNTASRMEGLTKVYGAGIVISEETLSRIKDAGNFRFLDKVKAHGKQVAVSVYELFDGDPEEIFNLKKRTKSDFEKAIRLYHGGKPEEAGEIFGNILKINKDDRAAALYAKRCENFVKYGIPADWDGVEEMRRK